MQLSTLLVYEKLSTFLSEYTCNCAYHARRLAELQQKYRDNLEQVRCTYVAFNLLKAVLLY